MYVGRFKYENIQDKWAFSKFQENTSHSHPDGVSEDWKLAIIISGE